MARSDYIYLVLDEHLPAAAFTVKYELINWLRSQPLRWRSGLKFYRLHDNPWMGKEPVELSLDELLR